MLQDIHHAIEPITNDAYQNIIRPAKENGKKIEWLFWRYPKLNNMQFSMIDPKHVRNGYQFLSPITQHVICDNACERITRITPFVMTSPFPIKNR